jgi:hypothetical protein
MEERTLMLKWTSIPSKTAVAVLAFTLAGGLTSFLQADRGGRGKTTNTSSSGGTETRLRAKSVTVIDGIQAELNGDFRSRPGEIRLKGELENVNRPVGSPISFCLNGAPLAFSTVELEIVNVAEFSLESKNGATVPTVVAGNTLEAHDGGTTGAPTCAGTLLATGTFK